MIKSDEEALHPILPWLYWWVDDDRDREFKREMFFLGCYEITGDFNVSAFEETIAFLLDRHESLRSSFIKVGEHFRMKVNDRSLPCYRVDYRNLINSTSNEEIIDFHQFKDHAFDTRSGPLFLVRLARTGQQKLLLSFKMHHVIYDGWSIDILFRDMKQAYVAFSEGRKPLLPTLKFQFKNYQKIALEILDRCINDHKIYWKAQFPQLPEELIIPGDTQYSKKIDPGTDTYLSETISLPNMTLEWASEFAKRNATTLSIILQASVRSYVFKISGQGDLVLGTQVFGRENLPGDIEHQIGSYVRMYLVRTIFQATDSFTQQVRKVKEATQATQTYNMYTLLDWFEELGHDQILDFWKISVQYTDSQTYLDTADSEAIAAPFEIRNLPNIAKEVLNIHMKLEFFRTGQNLDLKILYNSTFYSKSTIDQFIKGYCLHLSSVLRISQLRLDTTSRE